MFSAWTRACGAGIYLALGMLLLSATSANAAQVAPIIENANKLQFAQEVWKEYIRPLELKGKTGRAAAEVMLAEGFLCSISTESAFPSNTRPSMQCIKEPSGYGSVCNEFSVTMLFKPQTPMPALADFVKQLDTATVDDSFGFCPYTPALSVEYVGRRGAAEATLMNYIGGLGLANKKLNSVYETLLTQRFFCGFAPETDDRMPVSRGRQFLRTKRSSQIKFCFEQKLLMTIEWEAPAASRAQLISQMHDARVRSIESSCVIPALKPPGKGAAPA